MKSFKLIIAAALLTGFFPPAISADWNTLSGTGLTAAVSEVVISSAIPQVTAPWVTSPRRLICVDPGHPSSFNSGLEPVNGTNETRINWQVALKLERILREKGFDVLMTRTVELEYLENKERALIGNRSGAALYVHLHCESTPGTGFAIY